MDLFDRYRKGCGNRMRLERLHPLTLFLNLCCVMILAMFCMNPWIQMISCLGAVVLYLQVRGSRRKREWIWMVLFFVVMMFIHPLFNHNGKTVLLYINGNRITVEAFFYGAVTALMMAGILIWCRSLSLLMTSDRIVYLFGRISPKAALLCSMTLRFVPMFRRQVGKTRESQRLLGLYKEDTLLDKLRAELYVFSAVVTWAFEHSMDTADSMQARGYGTGKRTQYTDYRMRSVDIALSMAGIAITVWICIMYAGGTLNVTYYPAIRMPHTGGKEALTYVLYAVQCLLLPGVQFFGKGLEIRRK